MLALLILLAFLPNRGRELGQMIPVSLLYVYREGDELTVAADTGNYGSGKDLEEAIADLHRTATGTLYIRTADNLILTEDTKQLIPELYKLLRPSVQICIGQGNPDPKEADAYISANPTGMTLQDVMLGEKSIPVLQGGKGRYHYESNE